MSYITDLDTIQQLAAQRYDAFEVMRWQLIEDDDLTDEQIDAAVEAIAVPIIAAIDCTQCANCCRNLPVEVGHDDAEKLAEGLNLPVETVITRYIDREDKPDDAWGVIATKPCPLLKDKRCSVYAHRPESCAAYPAVTPNFRWLLAYFIRGAALCPIIYNVLDAMLDEVDRLQRDL